MSLKSVISDSKTSLPLDLYDVSQRNWHQKLRDFIGYQFFHLASLCTDAPCKMHENYMFLQLAKKVDPNTNLSKNLNQLSKKASLISQMVLLAPISLVTGPIGMISRFLGYSIQFSEFNYMQGEAKEKEYPSDDSISAFFLNSLAIGGGFPLDHGGALPWNNKIDDNSTRLEKIADTILQKDSDVVCLSEIYDFKAAQTLYNKLKGRYAHFYLNIGPHVWAAKSGLFVASKYKVQDPHFIDFHDTLVHNKNSNRRGAFGFNVANKVNESIAKIYSAHFEYSLNDSEPTDKEQKARKEEVDLIINDIDKKNDVVPTILIGDLNFSQEEYSKTDILRCFEKTNQDIKGTCRRDEVIEALSAEPERFPVLSSEQPRQLPRL